MLQVIRIRKSGTISQRRKGRTWTSGVNKQWYVQILCAQVFLLGNFRVRNVEGWQQSLHESFVCTVGVVDRLIDDKGSMLSFGFNFISNWMLTIQVEIFIWGLVHSFEIR